MPIPFVSDSRPASGLPRTLAALVCLGLAAVSILFFRRNLSERASSKAFVKRFALDLRRADEIGAMKFEREPDLAASIAANAVLRDAAAPLPSAVGLGAREEEIAGARELMLDALAKRPGWAYHRFLLGELAYEAGGPARVAKDWETWATPLRLAADAAPGLDASWSALGKIYLENWRELSPARRSEALPVIRRALQDSRFASSQFLAVLQAVGRDEAMSLLPENPELLAAAADALSSRGDLAAAAILLGRQEAAQKKARADQLRRIEARFRSRDQSGLQAACLDWATEHPVAALDDPAGRAQAARVLELWPGDQGGPWDSDPRADLVRFFLDGREAAVSAAILSRTLDALSDVPDHVTARVKLRAGDVTGAQELADRPENQGGAEWTLYYADLARLLLKQGHAREARGALDRFSLADRDDCDALLARRDVARALGDLAEQALVGQKLASLKGSPRRQELVPGGGRMSICVDPEQAGSLDVRLVPQGPAIVRYGWGSGRDGMLYLQNERVVSVPLAGLAGSRDLIFQSVAGASIRVPAPLPPGH